MGLISVFLFVLSFGEENPQHPSLFMKDSPTIIQDCDTEPEEGCHDPPCQTSPIVIDLNRDGFAFGGPEGAIWYDLLGMGKPFLLQWVRPGENDAFLVHDINRDGVVNDGSELFGNGTRLLLEKNQLARNGFLGLQQFDDPRLGGNDDGYISREDRVWENLYLWVDGDANGLSDSREMRALRDTEFLSLETIPKEAGIRDEHGNWLRFWAWSYKGGPGRQSEKLWMVDVFFKRLDTILN